MPAQTVSADAPATSNAPEEADQPAPKMPGFGSAHRSFLKSGEAPPPDYYRNNLIRVLTRAECVYGDLLTVEEQAFIDDYRGLSCPAQRLYARLAARKHGPILSRRIDYSEVAAKTAALEELDQADFVQLDGSWPADAVLSQLTLKEINNIFPSTLAVKLKQSRIDHIVSALPERECLRRVRAHCSWLICCHDDVLAIFLLLFYGGSTGQHTQQEFAIFVMEDLGVIRYETYSLSSARRLFESRTDLDDYLFLRHSKRHIQRLGQSWQSDLWQWLQARLAERSPHRLTQRLRDKRLCQLGRAAERAGEPVSALACYELTERAPAAERKARLLFAQGQRRACTDHLTRMARDSNNPSDRFFATTFARRKKLNIKNQLKPWQNPPEEYLRLTRSPEKKLELSVMENLAQRGDRCWFLENRFSLGLFGLALWDAVFANVEGMFVNEYQSAPLDLFWPDFARVRSDLIEQMLIDYAEPGNLRSSVLNRFDAKQGVTNALVQWRELDREVLEEVFRRIPLAHLLSILHYTVENLQHARRGFPDLLVMTGKGGYAFLEVKGPGDRLSLHQRSWFDLFDRCGISASVLKVSWC